MNAYYTNACDALNKAFTNSTTYIKKSYNSSYKFLSTSFTSGKKFLGNKYALIKNYEYSAEFSKTIDKLNTKANSVITSTKTSANNLLCEYDDRKYTQIKLCLSFNNGSALADVANIVLHSIPALGTFLALRDYGNNQIIHNQLYINKTSLKTEKESNNLKEINENLDITIDNEKDSYQTHLTLEMGETIARIAILIFTAYQAPQYQNLALSFCALEFGMQANQWLSGVKVAKENDENEGPQYSTKGFATEHFTQKLNSLTFTSKANTLQINTIIKDIDKQNEARAEAEAAAKTA